MLNDRREVILKIAAGAVIGLFLLDRMVLSPAIASWNEQSERIDTLRKKVQRGRQLVQRDRSIRDRWAEMHRTDLPDDKPTAENEVFKAVGRWAAAGRVGVTSLTPNWKDHEEDHALFECRLSATGDQASIGRLLYELEVDPLPARLEECEITSRDAKGQQLSISLRASFLKLAADGRNGK